MKSARLNESGWRFNELTPKRWADFEKLFGERGACGGCWCMWWRLTSKEFNARKGEGNRKGMKALVDSGHVPGIIAYHDERPVGWCSVAPREEFKRLEKSRTLKPVDEKPVWSVVCFFIAKEYRRRGVAHRLLEAAVEHVGAQGGKIVEGYAVRPRKGVMPDVFAYPGPVSLFESAGFREVARPSETRSIMRYVIRSNGRLCKKRVERHRR